MSRIADFFKNFKQRYDANIIRNAQLDKFLAKQDTRDSEMRDINDKIDVLSKDINSLHSQVDQIQEDVQQIQGKMSIIGKGTKMELFDTLYHWKKILCERGWKTRDEMREVQKLWEIYHEGLDGNGLGESYFLEIKALPERDINSLSS